MKRVRLTQPQQEIFRVIFRMGASQVSTKKIALESSLNTAELAEVLAQLRIGQFIAPVSPTKYTVHRDARHHIRLAPRHWTVLETILSAGVDPASGEGNECRFDDLITGLSGRLVGGPQVIEILDDLVSFGYVETDGARFWKSDPSLVPGWTKGMVNWPAGPKWQDECLVEDFPTGWWIPTSSEKGQAILATTI